MKQRLRALTVLVVVALAPFLAFHLELMVGRVMTPIFGGASDIWLILLVFFQLFLLVGYAYVYLMSKLSSRRQLVIHKIVLLCAITASLFRIHLYGSMLSPLSADLWSAEGTYVYSPLILWLLANLTVPFTILFSTSILLITWNIGESKWPHRLFAVSNAGSMLGLVLYPLFTERLLGLGQQSLLWSVIFVVTTALYLAVILKAKAPGLRPRVDSPEEAQDGAGLLAFLVSAFTAFLLSTTTGLTCENIVPAPFLWILPLSCYMLSFVIAFSRKVSLELPARAVFVTAIATGACLYFLERVGLALYLAAVNIGFLLTCIYFHRVLARHAPADTNPKFYLLLATGGVTGTLAAVAVPVILNAPYQSELLAAAVLLPVVITAAERRKRLTREALIFLMLFSLPWAYAYGKKVTDGQLVLLRNLYGTVRASRMDFTDGNSLTLFLHGNIEHGRQYRRGHLRYLPTAYFTTNSGLADAFAEVREAKPDGELNIGCVGLGVGTICAYGEPGDRIVFYELNPNAIDLATNVSLFTYVDDCRSDVEILCGDARLLMQEEVNSGVEGLYDILIIDAFSSGAMPTHLLTKEAFDIYCRLMKPEGTLVINMTNAHVDLRNVIARACIVKGLPFRFVQTEGAKPGGKPSRWGIAGRDTRAPSIPEAVMQEYLAFRMWTDDYIDIMGHLARKPLEQ